MHLVEWGKNLLAVGVGGGSCLGSPPPWSGGKESQEAAALGWLNSGKRPGGSKALGWTGFKNQLADPVTRHSSVSSSLCDRIL